MAKLINNHIYLDTGKFVFDFKFSEAVTLILGDAASGKTLFYNKLQARAIARGIDTFKFFNYKSDADGLKLLLDLYEDKIIIIDNADVLLDDSFREKIYYDKRNQYIILGREIGRYPVRKLGIASIIEDNMKFSLQYIFKPKE